MKTEAPRLRGGSEKMMISILWIFFSKVAELGFDIDLATPMTYLPGT